MRPNPGKIISSFLVLTVFVSSIAHAKPEVLAALFQMPVTPKGKKLKVKVKAAPLLPIPEEYRVYFKAKAMLDHPGDAASIEAIERQILLTKLQANSRSLDKEL